mgnify:CR=1 FL=1
MVNAGLTVLLMENVKLNLDFNFITKHILKMSINSFDELTGFRDGEDDKYIVEYILADWGGFCHFVGFEIDQEYYDKQEKRFNDFKSQLRLF